MSTPQPPSPAGPDDDGRGLSGLQRAMIVLGALAVVLVAFVLIQGSGDDEGSGSTTSAQTATTQAPTTQTTETGEATTTTETTTTETTTTETTTTTEPPEPEEETVRVVNGEPEGGVQRLTFERGDRIRFKVASDVADEVHVHGYDLTEDVSPDRDARFRFEATIEGRFEVELHGTGTQIAELEVAPS